MRVTWDDGAEALKLKSILRGELPLDRLCPCCKGEELHVFFHRHRSDTGGGWVWCSRCRRFLHATVAIPGWWQNLEVVPELALTGIPEELDRFSDEIDKHVAALQAGRQHWTE